MPGTEIAVAGMERAGSNPMKLPVPALAAKQKTSGKYASGIVPVGLRPTSVVPLTTGSTDRPNTPVKATFSSVTVVPPVFATNQWRWIDVSHGEAGGGGVIQSMSPHTSVGFLIPSVNVVSTPSRF